MQNISKSKDFEHFCAGQPHEVWKYVETTTTRIEILSCYNSAFPANLFAHLLSRTPVTVFDSLNDYNCSAKNVQHQKTFESSSTTTS